METFSDPSGGEPRKKKSLREKSFFQNQKVRMVGAAMVGAAFPTLVAASVAVEEQNNIELVEVQMKKLKKNLADKDKELEKAKTDEYAAMEKMLEAKDQRKFHEGVSVALCDGLLDTVRMTRESLAKEIPKNTVDVKACNLSGAIKYCAKDGGTEYREVMDKLTDKCEKDNKIALDAGKRGSDFPL